MKNDADITHTINNGKQKNSQEINAAQQFRELCKSKNFVGFSFPSLASVPQDDGQYKKKIEGCPKWRAIDETNYLDYIADHHRGFAIRTGRQSGVTVIDCDCTDSYQAIIQTFPELQQTYTVKTAKGFHLYCQYQPGVKSNSQSFRSYPNVDIRNDEGILFAPPTQYQNCITGAIERYQLADHSPACASFVKIPKPLLKDLKAYGEPKMTIPAATTQTATMEKPTTSNGDQSDVDTVPPTTTTTTAKTTGAYDEIKELLESFPPEHFESFDRWFKTGAIIFNELGDTTQAVTLFHEHSKRPECYAKVKLKEIRRVWNQFSASWMQKATKASLYKWCRAYNPEKFHSIRDSFQVFDFRLITTTNIANFFIQWYGDDFLLNKNTLYWWDDKQSIWTNEAAYSALIHLIGNDMFRQLRDLLYLEYKHDINQIRQLFGEIKKIQDRKFKENIAKDVKTELPNHNVDFDTNPEQHTNLQFQNGVLMLEKVRIDSRGNIDTSMAFRKRNQQDYVTQLLPYDFAKPPLQAIAKVAEVFEQIQPDQAQRDFQLGWLAYCLTGHTKEQRFKMNIGYSASNGKSTEQQIHSQAFPVYSFKLNKATFNLNYSKAHKQLIHLLHKPIRYACIEEMDRSRVDAELVKGVVDGNDQNVEVMFGTSVAMPIQAKLNTCSNSDPNIKNDGGIGRRGLVQFYISRFVADPDPTKQHEYPLNTQLQTDMQQTEFKLAYLFVLLPYVVQYFQNGKVLIPESASKHFNEVADDYDAVKTALFDVCEKTDNLDERVSKTELLQAINKSLDSRFTWNQLLPELKRHQLKYDRTKRLNGERGVVLGLKWSTSYVTEKMRDN